MSQKKQQLRNQVWSELRNSGEARFPYPVEGRIPNFNGAEEAARQLTKTDPFQQAEVLKINPDSPQRPVRIQALKMEKTLLIPTPRLKNGFYKIEGSTLSDETISDASTLDGISNYGTYVPPEKLCKVDMIVTGSVVASTEGGRIGKGEGFSDLEYAIMKEMGGSDVPIATSIHSKQLVDECPTEPHDISLDWIVTADVTIETKTSLSKPDGINWSLLSEDDLQAMPILQELKKDKRNS